MCFSKTGSYRQNQRRSWRSSDKECPLCKAANKPSHHYLSECTYLPEKDRAYITKKQKSKTRTIKVDIPVSDSEDGSTDSESEDHFESTGHTTAGHVKTGALSRHVDAKQSPTFRAFYKHDVVNIMLDTGAEVTLIRQCVAQYLGLKVKKTSQKAFQADGVTPLDVVGETSFIVSVQHVQLKIEALVVTDVDIDILAGMPCMEANDIFVSFPVC